MPAVHIQLSHTLGNEDIQARVSQAVLDITEKVLGKDRAVTAIFIDTLPTSNWWIDGTTLAELQMTSYCLNIRITDETNTKKQKAEYIQRIHGVMEHLLGRVHPCSYVHVHDVRATSYGYEGKTQEHRYQAGLPSANVVR